MIDISRKLSADDEHPLMGQMRVYLDGDELRHVTAYDIDAGTVTHLVHTDHNTLVCVNGEFATRTRRGSVRVVVKV